MNTIDLKSHIMKHVQLKKLYLTGDKNHIHIIAIGEIFIGMSSIEKQKTIYQPIIKYIVEKKIHAVTIDTFTVDEWKYSELKKKRIKDT
ncbi:BolA/IbaG family iron-sulfur metabolism protein [Buchnera aphidicola]|uniref:BolA/IbaG family iron-sulfur metabolism protein n=1 Tax=Buchnera aphidicola TaxID=9 RepID=UPI003464DFFA